MKCPKCGGKLLFDEEENIYLCSDCKAKFKKKKEPEKTYQEPVISYNTNLAEEQPDTGSKTGGFLLGFFLGLVGLIIALCIGKEDTKHSAVKGFVISLILSVVISVLVYVFAFASVAALY